MRKIKITTIILAIILITLVAFGGVYIKTQNRMENKVKEYDFARELNGGRVIEMKVATAEGTKPNPEDLTVENYEIVKKTIETRLNSVGAQDYTISLNKENGNITVELAEDESTDIFVYFLTASGEVQIKEKDTNTELLSDSMVKKAVYTYTADMEGAYQVILEIHLTEEGQAKIEEIKNNYAVLVDEIADVEAAESSKEEETEGEGANAETTESTPENEEKQEETKKIALFTIAGTEYDIEKIEKNKITVNMGGQTTNTSTINNNISAAAELSILINSGKYPINYEIQDNRLIYADITEMQMLYFAITVAGLILIALLALTIKYKTKGLLASISFIGFASIFLLILRYTNVNISIEGIGAIILSLIINFRINQLILRGDVDYKNMLLKLAPVAIITLVFCFAGWSNLSSFGTIMFWGFALIAAYNASVTKTLLKLKENK